ncbi:MAG: Mn-dependent DtxR family transcriptional regulator, partial [Flavobacteriales bacterium]
STYTEKQRRYLAFIPFYTRGNGRPPAQVDMQKFFGVTAPTVHQMVRALEKHGLIQRTPREARSLRVIAPVEDLHRWI